MAEPDEREAVAAEYVLGTLDAEERQAVERDMADDAGLAAILAAWERRLLPLALALEPVEVPPRLRDRVMAAISATDAPTSAVIVFRRRAARWRAAAVAAMALAAALAGAIVYRQPPVVEGGRYVAVLQGEGVGPAFLAAVDLKAGTVTVRPVTAATPAGKSYELWAVGGGRDRPQSLGVIGADFRIPARALGTFDRAVLAETVFAVSLEPQGGSPTGQPTGPVLFSGKLIATE
jgi:anti-sigma-K factor RskA